MHTHAHTHTHTHSQGRNKMKCIEHKAQTDGRKQSPQPDHQWQSNNTSTLINASVFIHSSSLPSSSFTSSDELLPTSQVSIIHGSPSTYLSTGSISSLNTTSALSTNSAPKSSPSYSPLPQPQSSNPSPVSSALLLDSSASPAGSNFSGVSQTTMSWISSQRSIPLIESDIAQVPVEGVVTQDPEVQNVQSPPFVQNRIQSLPTVSGSILSTSSRYTNSRVVLPAQQNFSSGGSLSADSCSPYNFFISTASTLPSSMWSPEMGTSLQTSVSTNSIPAATSASVPFKNSPQTSNFLPQSLTLNDFNPHIPSSFNFSYTHSSNFGTSSNSALESQQIINTYSSLFLNSGDFITHQSSDVTPNGDTSNTGDAVAPVSESDSDNMNSDSTLSNPHPPMTQGLHDLDLHMIHC